MYCMSDVCAADGTRAAVGVDVDAQGLSKQQLSLEARHHLQARSSQ